MTIEAIILHVLIWVLFVRVPTWGQFIQLCTLRFVCSISSKQWERKRKRDASKGCTEENLRFLPEGCLGCSLFFTTDFVVLNAMARIGKQEGRLSTAHGVGQGPGSLKDPKWYDVS